MASGTTWQDRKPSDAKTWHRWNANSWDRESEAEAKTWQEGSGRQPNTAGNTTWQAAEPEATPWQDTWQCSTTQAWQRNADLKDTVLTPPLQDEIRALMEQVSKVPLLMEEVLELKTQVSELPLLKEEVLELKTQVRQVSELKEALEQNKQKDKQKKNA